MVRQATLEDLEDITKLVIRFIEEDSPYKNAYKVDKVLSIIESLIEDKENGIVLLAELEKASDKETKEDIVPSLSFDKDIYSTAGRPVHKSTLSTIDTIDISNYKSNYDISHDVLSDSSNIECNSSNSVLSLDSSNNSNKSIIGILIGLSKPFLLSDIKVSTEIAWYVIPEYRANRIGKALLDTFEEWSINKGCKAISMYSINNNISKFYEAQGYSLYEQVYLKELI